MGKLTDILSAANARDQWTEKVRYGPPPGQPANPPDSGLFEIMPGCHVNLLAVTSVRVVRDGWPPKVTIEWDESSESEHFATIDEAKAAARKYAGLVNAAKAGKLAEVVMGEMLKKPEGQEQS